MSSNKNISRRIKKEILNNDCDYDTLYNELLMYPEEVLSGILNSYLYLFRNITTINNKTLLEDLNSLLSNYIKKNKNKKDLERVYNKIEVFLSNITLSFDLEKLLQIEDYLSELINLQNQSVINNKKRAKGDKYNFMLFLIFEKNVFLRGKLYNKLFNDSEEDYLRILKTSPKNFVWELIDKIENELYTTKEEVAKDYNVSFIIPKYEEYVYLPNGKIDLTQEEIFTIDNEGDMCLDDAMSIKRNDNGTYTLFIHLANPTATIPYESNTMHEALKRNHTIYLSNNSIPIFDRYLSDNILSILPNKNTNALTIKVGVTPDYSLDLDTLEIIPSIIKNKHKLTYQGAEEIITSTGLLHDDLILISKIFDKQAIDNPRVRAYHHMKERINNQKEVDSEAPIAHMMVEQCNVFANSTIHLIDKREHLGLIMPWRVQREENIELIEKYLEHGSFDINSSGLQLLLKNYMTKSKYSYTNIGHQGLGIDGYVKISSAARRAMDALAVYVLYDLYINRSTDDLDSKYYYWEKEIKYWCEYANNKASDNITFMEQYNYLSSKGKILERRK